MGAQALLGTDKPHAAHVNALYATRDRLLPKLHDFRCEDQPQLCAGGKGSELVNGGTAWLLESVLDANDSPSVYDAVLDEIDDHNLRTDAVTRHVVRRLHSEFLLQDAAPAINKLRAALPHAPRWVSEAELAVLKSRPWIGGRSFAFVRREAVEMLEDAVEMLKYVRRRPGHAWARVCDTAWRTTWRAGGVFFMLWVADKLDAVVWTTNLLKRTRVVTTLRALLVRPATAAAAVLKQLLVKLDFF